MLRQGQTPSLGPPRSRPTAPAVVSSSPQNTTPVFSSVSTSTVATTPVFNSASAAGVGVLRPSRRRFRSPRPTPSSTWGPVRTPRRASSRPACPALVQQHADLRLLRRHAHAQQQAAFSNTVFQRVEQTFQQSGVPVALTTDPSVAAAHTLSLVSNTSASLLPTAIGMTDVGANGFSFIDQQAKSAQSLDQLEWIVAHNISHELMLAFGVGENYDTTGQLHRRPERQPVDDDQPDRDVQPGRGHALNQAIAAQDSSGATSSQFAQVLVAQAVPEPSSIALWGLLALGGLATAKRRGW